MDLTISQGDLSKLLQRTAPIAETKSPISALTCVLLVASDNVLTARATDQYLGIEARVDAAVKVAGSYAVDAKKALDIAQSLPDADVRIRLVGNALELSTGKAPRFKLPALPADTFPELQPATAAKKLAVLRGGALSTLLAKGSYAADKDVTSAKNATSLDVADGRLRALSLDFGRFSKVELACDTAAGSALLPSGAVRDVRSLADSAKDADVTVSTHGGYAFFATNSAVLSVKMAESFPSVPVLIRGIGGYAAAAKQWATFDRDTLMTGIKRVRLAANKRGDALGVVLSFTPNQLRISGATDGTEGEDLVECNGDAALEIEIQPSFFLDALSAVDDDVVRIGPTADTVLVRGDSSDDVLGVIMTMRRV